MYAFTARRAGRLAPTMSRENWVGLESNPQVMTEYAHKLGMASAWEFTDVLGLDEQMLKLVPEPCAGCIFLYPFGEQNMLVVNLLK